MLLQIQRYEKVFSCKKWWDVAAITHTLFKKTSNLLFRQLKINNTWIHNEYVNASKTWMELVFPDEKILNIFKFFSIEITVIKTIGSLLIEDVKRTFLWRLYLWSAKRTKRRSIYYNVKQFTRHLSINRTFLMIYHFYYYLGP